MGDVRMRAICVRQIKLTYVSFSAHVKIASRRVHQYIVCALDGQMWTSAPSLTVDVSRRAAMRTARIRAAVKLASFSRPTAKSATVSDRRRTLCVCVCV